MKDSISRENNHSSQRYSRNVFHGLSDSKPIVQKKKKSYSSPSPTSISEVLQHQKQKGMMQLKEDPINKFHDFKDRKHTSVNNLSANDNNLTQRKEVEEELQMKSTENGFPEESKSGVITNGIESNASKANNTGLPDGLKNGVEQLSGYLMDDVRVHYNSDKPAQLDAHAYAQGSDIHLASGQEKHLPHEAWHVVQQKQGRVKPTIQMKGNLNINDDLRLEQEADEMGSKALVQKKEKGHNIKNQAQGIPTIQRVVYRYINKNWKPVKEQDNHGKYPLPETAPEKYYFNDVNGKYGETFDSVMDKEDPDKDDFPIFKELLQKILNDDKLEESDIDISWKHSVMKHRHNEEKLYELSEDITKVSGKGQDMSVSENMEYGEIGELQIGELGLERLSTQDQLLSKDAETRTKAVGMIRGSDESYSELQGPILRQFIAEERAAILGLIRASSDVSAIFSLERGGSMIADLMDRLTPHMSKKENHKILKPNEKNVLDYLEANPIKEKESKAAKIKKKMLQSPENQKQVHVDMFKRAIKAYIEMQPPGQITIGVTETAVGGGSANSMMKTISELCNELKDIQGKKVKFKVLIARETIKNNNYKGSGVLKLNDPYYLENGKDGVKSDQRLESENPHEVEMYISQTRYLIGEDVDYQLKYEGGNSGKPVIVFEESDGLIKALSITPAEDNDSARLVIMDLIAGVYDNLMQQLF